MVTVPEQLPNVLDRAIRIAIAQQAPTAIIIPSDVQELEYTPPGHAFKEVPSSLGIAWPEVDPDAAAVQRAAEILNAGSKVALLVGQGAHGARAEVEQVADLLGAGAAKALLGKDVLPDDLPWVTGSHRPAGHAAELRDDDGLRHAAHRRLELPVHPVHAAARAGAGGADRHRRPVHRHALPVRGQPRRRRGLDPAGADPAAAAQDRPRLARGHRGGRPRAGGRPCAWRRWSRPTRSTRCGCSGS